MRTYLFALGVTLFLCYGCGKAHKRTISSINKYCILPFDAEDKSDVRWSTYLMRHLDNRSGHSGLVVNEFNDEHATVVTVNVDSLMKEDYGWSLEGNEWKLTARTSSGMLWLIYQFISFIAESDPRIQAPDIPPAILSGDYVDGNFAFEYRGIYTPSNADPEYMPILASHNVDYDWGLWGHNLPKVFSKALPREVWAEVNGKLTPDQFCFSSEMLYDSLEFFILNNYGEGNTDEPVRFAIMPSDNALVCTCSHCRKAGNTSIDASPAVANLLARLAVRFPNHLFFTSSYGTVRRVPQTSLPSNTGVLVSAMSLPFKSVLNDENAVKRFRKQISDWRTKVGRVYVWDYMRNFDDYFTPYPCLHVIQERLRFYRNLGVQGIFFNGSAPDYATFDDVQTQAIAALMINPDLKVDDFVEKFWERFYPVSGAILQPFYAQLENNVQKNGGPLPLYAGIGQAVSGWLEPDTFVNFLGALDSLSKHAREEERRRLNQLLTALSYTRLELMRLNDTAYNSKAVSAAVESLRGYAAFENMSHYRESDGELSDYIKQWEEMAPWGYKRANRLYRVRVDALSRLDADYCDTGLLTDGKQAFPTDYHTGWLIVSADTLLLRLPGRVVTEAGQLSASFLCAPRWRIELPLFVELKQNEHSIGHVTVNVKKDIPTRHTITCNWRDAIPGKPIDLLIVRSAGNHATMACDEIELYSK